MRYDILATREWDSMAATGTVGKVEEFDSSKEEWAQYIERLGHFFAANGITSADRKRSILLTVIGPATYKLLRNLVAPEKPGTRSYEQNVQALSDHF